MQRISAHYLLRRRKTSTDMFDGAYGVTVPDIGSSIVPTFTQRVVVAERDASFVFFTW